MKRMKRYRLLKDLPGFLICYEQKDIPVGTIFEQKYIENGDHSYWLNSESHPYFTLCADQVEKNKLWFEEI